MKRFGKFRFVIGLLSRLIRENETAAYTANREIKKGRVEVKACGKPSLEFLPEATGSKAEAPEKGKKGALVVNPAVRDIPLHGLKG